MIIGRKKEQKKLEKAFQSNKAQFITVYGRRRVGKTYLISEFFSQKQCRYFYTAGLQNSTQERQLISFAQAFSLAFMDGVPVRTPANWLEAFELLHERILKTDERVVIFLDELPWMATRKSTLMQEIEHYWNRYWSKIPRVTLIVCGSSASWIIKKIIFNKGGLHNRTTLEIHMKPFNLLETKQYLVHNGITLNNKHLLALYMAIGGIPYYLDYVDAGLSAQENIQAIFFDANAPLRTEFDKLFDSLFEGADAYKELITIIAQKREGISRADLKASARLSSDGGRLTNRLDDLRLSGFIDEAVPWGKTKGEFYRVVDEFCLFYLHWVVSRKHFVQGYWIKQSQRPAYYAWAGYAFEAVVMKHYDQIVQALHIEAAIDYGWWRYVPKNAKEQGAQVDFIIDRSDNAITICEIKYTDQPFAIDKSYAAKLTHNMELFKEKTKTDKQIFFAMISASGLKETAYSKQMVSRVAVLDDFFK